MRPALLLLALGACQPTGIQTTTDKTNTNDGATHGGDDDDTTVDTHDSGSTTDSGSTSDTSTSTYLASCPSQPDTIGPWDTHPITVAGAGWTNDPYTFDGGVAAVLSAALGVTTTGTAGSTVSIPVTRAIVTSVGYRPTSGATFVEFWFEDGNAAMDAYNVDMNSTDVYNVNPGAEVAFTVTAVKNFFDSPEVVAISDFQLLSTGNDVHIVDAMSSGQPLDFATQGLHTIEVWGQLVSGPTACGSANCWQFQYGSNVVTYRSGSSYDYLGDCVHYIGPELLFGGAPQIEAKNFDWAFRF